MLPGRRPARDRRRAGAGGSGAPTDDRGGRGDRRLSGTAILNGFGRSLGDGIVGLQALSVALAAGAVSRAVLFRLPGLPPVLQALYRAADFVSVATLPWAAATPDVPFDPGDGLDRCIDLRDFAFDPAFRGVAMIDFFLQRLGMVADGVAAEAKRNAWLRRAVPMEGRMAGGRGYVLLCPRASMALRDMPAAVERAIRGWFARHTTRPLVLQHPVETLAALCRQVAQAVLVVSTDTATVHLADAYSVPCLAFFPTHQPEWRMRDYPFCRGIRLHARSLEPAQEFSRGPSDDAAARAAWFPCGDDLEWLHAALAEALHRAERGR